MFPQTKNVFRWKGLKEHRLVRAFSSRWINHRSNDCDRELFLSG